MATQLACTQVVVGDVIYIEASSGAVKRVGRCDLYATEFDLEVRMSSIPQLCTIFTHKLLQRKIVCIQRSCTRVKINDVFAFGICHGMHMPFRMP